MNKVPVAMGCSEDDARTASKALLLADLRGIDSYGVARVSGYVRLWESKRVKARPCIKVTYETPSTAVVDGDGGFGAGGGAFCDAACHSKAQQEGPGG